jgi:hypothetical protein
MSIEGLLGCIVDLVFNSVQVCLGTIHVVLESRHVASHVVDLLYLHVDGLVCMQGLCDSEVVVIILLHKRLNLVQKLFCHR